MAGIVIVSGCPGSGKTTLAAALARAAPQGLHLPSDPFYELPVHPIDPTRPESHAQNTAIVRAVARAARALAEGGYDTLLDGIFGPWFMPLLREELGGGPPVSYLVLRVPLDEALRRVREREGPGESAKVRHMHAAFADLGPWERHAIETLGRRPDVVRADAARGLAEGRFRLGESPAW